MAAKKRTHARKRSHVRRHKSNPSTQKRTPKLMHEFTNAHKRRHARRHHRNPDGGANSMDPTKGQNIVQVLGGTAAGAFGVPIIGNMLSASLGLTGNSKLLAQLGISAALIFLGKKIGMAKLGLAAGIAGAAVTIYQYSQESGLMAGAEQMLGLVPSRNGFDNNALRNLNNFTRNLVNARATTGIHGLVPRSTVHGINTGAGTF